MRGLIIRTAALALCVSVGLGAAARPCEAADAAKTTRSLTDLSAASRAVLLSPQQPSNATATSAPKLRSNQAQTPAGGSGQSFFKTTKGKVTLALMGAGVGFTIWSINHDRKPVKSPVR